MKQYNVVRTNSNEVAIHNSRGELFSKSILEQFNIPKDLKIIAVKYKQ